MAVLFGEATHGLTVNQLQNMGNHNLFLVSIGITGVQPRMEVFSCGQIVARDCL